MMNIYIYSFFDCATTRELTHYTFRTSLHYRQQTRTGSECCFRQPALSEERDGQLPEPACTNHEHTSTPTHKTFTLLRTHKHIICTAGPFYSPYKPTHFALPTQEYSSVSRLQYSGVWRLSVELAWSQLRCETVCESLQTQTQLGVLFQSNCTCTCSRQTSAVKHRLLIHVQQIYERATCTRTYRANAYKHTIRRNPTHCEYR